MFWIIFSIIVTIGAFIGLGFCKDDHDDIVWKINKKSFISLIGLLLIFF